MKKFDYVIENQRYSLSQFRNVAEYRALIDSDAECKNGLQANVQYLLDSIDINKAQGFILDFWGWLVGTARGYFDITQYFCFNRPDVNTEKYIFFSRPRGDGVIISGDLEDRNFRARIMAKAGSNASKCTREDNINIIKNMTLADKVIIKNVDIMTLDVRIIGKNLFITDTIRSDIEAVIGRGVELRNLSVEEIN